MVRPVPGAEPSHQILDTGWAGATQPWPGHSGGSRCFRCPYDSIGELLLSCNGSQLIPCAYSMQSRREAPRVDPAGRHHFSTSSAFWTTACGTARYEEYINPLHLFEGTIHEEAYAQCRITSVLSTRQAGNTWTPAQLLRIQSLLLKHMCILNKDSALL